MFLATCGFEFAVWFQFSYINNRCSLRDHAFQRSVYSHVDWLIDWCVLFSHMCLPSPSSHAARLRSVPLVVLGFVPGSLLQGWRSPSHPLHPLAASQLWHPMPWAGGTGWMCAAQLYETAVTHEGHTHIYCQYLTLGLWCYYCWTSKKKKKKERNVSASFVDYANDLCLRCSHAGWISLLLQVLRRPRVLK